jgi:hypothetical protein
METARLHLFRFIIYSLTVLQHRFCCRLVNYETIVEVVTVLCFGLLQRYSVRMLALKKLLADHPTLATFGLGLAITLIIGAAIGTLDHQQAAFAVVRKHALRHSCASAEWAAVHHGDVIN